MKIFPAIDIKDKKCVRLVKGDFDNKTEYEMTPFEQAGKYKDHGFKNLHIVDLDGALTGETLNLDIIQNIVSKFDLEVEIGGGIMSVSGWKENSNRFTLDYLKEVNDYGVSRLIYTDINRDGMKQSPNFEETSKVAEISNCPIVISGGVSSIEDIKKSKTLKNIEGIIVGKAIYDKDISLSELASELES